MTETMWAEFRQEAWQQHGGCEAIWDHRVVRMQQVAGAEEQRHKDSGNFGTAV